MLEFMVDPALCHNCVCCMPWFYLRINCYITVGDGTVPNVMIAFSASHKRATVLQHDFPHFLFVFSHYRTILSCRSDLNVRVSGCWLGVLSSISSGMAKRARSNSASKEPDSSTSPGMSSLVAIHTSASESHVFDLCIYLFMSWSRLL